MKRAIDNPVARRLLDMQSDELRYRGGAEETRHDADKTKSHEEKRSNAGAKLLSKSERHKAKEEIQAWNMSRYCSVLDFWLVPHVRIFWVSVNSSRSRGETLVSPAVRFCIFPVLAYHYLLVIPQYGASYPTNLSCQHVVLSSLKPIIVGGSTRTRLLVDITLQVESGNVAFPRG